ncbi:MAG: hypothetical protein ACREFY_21460 [Acetobacteraceae bacterium]
MLMSLIGRRIAGAPLRPDVAPRAKNRRSRGLVAAKRDQEVAATRDIRDPGRRNVPSHHLMGRRDSKRYLS